MQRMEIVVKWWIDRSRSETFDGFEIIHAAEQSVLVGHIQDQAELRGILTRLADLGLELISVNTLSKPHTGGGAY